MTKKGFFKGAALGAVVGSVAAILMAPKTGKQTRSDIKKVTDVLSKRVQKEARAMSGVTQDAYDTLVKRSVSDYAKGKRLANDYLNDVTSVLMKQWSIVKKELDDVSKEVKSATKAVKKVAKKKVAKKRASTRAKK